MFKKRILFPSSVFVVSSLIRPDLAYSEEKSEFKGKDILALYFSKESKSAMNNFLVSRGTPSDSKVDFVAFCNRCNEDEMYIYQPLFGSRVAFRLKGLIKIDDKIVAGTGRLSNMVGEVTTESYEAVMPVIDSSHSSEASQLILDLPTRLKRHQFIDKRPFWKGKVPSGEVNGIHHPSISGVSYIPLTKENQIVVDGYLCSSAHVNEEGACLFERDEDIIPSTGNQEEENSEDVIDPTSENQIPVDEIPNKDTENINKDEEENKDEDNTECPVCKYMKSGPCGEFFIKWEECIQNIDNHEDMAKCAAFTASMMKCMKNVEYYDIMTAGMDFSLLEKLEGTLENSEEEKQH